MSRGQATQIPDSVQRAVQALHQSDPEDHERHMVDRLPERGTGARRPGMSGADGPHV
jgi:hypothetical protein